MKEHYCTYEQAVALKRLGFDWDVRGYYTRDDNFQKVREITAFNHNDTRFKALYSAPRIDQAAARMREVKGWHIQVRINGIRSAYWWEIWSTMPNGPVYGTPDDETFRRGQYESYEQALSAGINKVLELLRKEVGE